MPAKYRKMADFHEYYSGARKAPYLTIFIGGNHEASNHLFELYYGGWVAPNIYYMGAANILRLGPLRIAGLSGIWKGYDYRKPHFERVPYNEADTVSIFHVRELDVRKMLCVRTQVDIGLSHDWPQGVEWKGDHRGLFRKKDRFEADANDGKLGSIAAKQCLDRLRPSHWFSAHLHIKYAAYIHHGVYDWVREPQEYRPRHGARLVEPVSSRADIQYKNETASNISDATSGPLVPGKYHNQDQCVPKTAEHAQVSAWQNFQVEATKAETHDSQLWLREQRERTAEEQRTGDRIGPQFMFDETWKQVQVDDGVDRGVTSVSKSIRSPGGDAKISNVDGCMESKLKRARSTSQEGMAANDQATPPPKLKNFQADQLDGQVPASVITGIGATRNLDEIEIDLSDSSSEDAEAEMQLSRSKRSDMVAKTTLNDGPSRGPLQNSNKRAKSEALLSDDSDEGGVKLDPTSPSFVPKTRASVQPSLAEEKIKEEATTNSDTMEVDQEKVPETTRAQLAELSSTFAPVTRRQPASATLPLPEGIANTTTQFLALDKCERGRDFLQLLEVGPISEQPYPSNARPYRLQYDKEWLAILRVFAPELELGGDPNGKIPPYRGDTYYRERIIEEEEWVDDHVVQTGRITVPENFSITAPVYDPDEEVAATDMPQEYTSPQTSTFCDLIGIDNQFNISNQEREIRQARGPRADEKKFSGGDGCGGRGGRNNGYSARGRGSHNRARGGRGGRGGGRGGRGRGRGQGC